MSHCLSAQRLLRREELLPHRPLEWLPGLDQKLEQQGRGSEAVEAVNA